MQRYIQRFLERPKSHKVGLWMGSFALFIFVFWQYFYAPLGKQHTEIAADIEKLQTEKINEQRLIKSLAKVKKAVDNLNLHLKEALAELPDEGEIPELLTSVSNLAKESGLDVKTFKPKAENIQEFYAEIPVKLEVLGNYHQVASFFDEVGHMKRIVNISEISMKDPDIEEGNPKAKIKADCVATTFRYLSEDEKSEKAVKKQ